MKLRPSNLSQRAGWRRYRAFVPLVFLAAVGFPLAGPTATLADSVSAPDSARRAVLQLALVTFDDVRVVADGSKFFSHDAAVSSDGLRLRLRSVSQRITAPPQERLVPWAEIESIHVRRGASAVGPLAGAALGFAIGLVISIQQPFDPFGEANDDWGKPIVVGMLGGAAVGALLTRAGPWHPVYP